MPAVEVIAILVHVTEPEAAVAWYARAFPRGRLGRVGDPIIPILELGSVKLEFVQVDEKVSSGAAGTVVYWQVEDFDSALGHLESVGAQLYRGLLIPIAQSRRRDGTDQRIRPSGKRHASAGN